MEKYKDSTLPVSERVEDLLSRMTLEEKAAQLCGDLPFSVMGERGISKEKLKEKFPDGHGRFTQFSTLGLQDPLQIAYCANEIQRYFVEETRLGIPVALQSENLCGYPGVGGTIFPSQMNVGFTWMPELAKKMAEIIGEESKAVGINSAMSPVIDITRDPRWGRTYETYGEDPYLTSQMGINYIQGMQKEKSNGVACIAKHFLGYSETQGGLNTAVTRVTDRELYEVFATPFEAAAKEADVSGMMASYSEIDGQCVAGNKKIATTLLRDTMGFRGMLTSDGAGVLKMYTDFHTAATYEEAGLIAKKAGLDTEIPVGNAFKKLPDYVREGRLEESLVDDSVRRILTIKFEYGLFENPYVNLENVKSNLNNEEKNRTAEEIAEKSIVLLKNDGILPLKEGMKVALIGPHADSIRYPISGYTYPAYIEMLQYHSKNAQEKSNFNGMADEARKNKDKENPFAAFGKAGALAKEVDMESTLRTMAGLSLKDMMSERYDVSYIKGCDIMTEGKEEFEAALEAAKESDVVIFACGGNSGWVNVTGGEGIDRCQLKLPGVQQELLETVAQAGKPIILIIYGPGIFSLPWAAEHTSAMIQASLPGMQAGRVITNVLDGTVNPGGKLTVTIPRSVGQIPVTYNHRTGSGYLLPERKGDGANGFIFHGGYVDEDDIPLFCFGHGISYTDFKLSDCRLDSLQVPTDGEIVVSCKVKNTGKVTGDEVVQLYYHTKIAHVVRPVQQLAGFKRVKLDPGEEKTVTFTLPCSQLGFYNEEMQFVVEPTKMDVMLGTSAHDIFFTEEVELTGEVRELMGRRSYTCKVSVS
ncbi:MAG TPA: beta-glucosidase [Clostridiales bacterium]|nr:beta-glucosidase [Clostridiales bacterium]